MQAIVNGEPGGAIGADDRGLRYGDGVFETIAVAERRPLLWAAHWARLAAGCERLGIAVPDEDTVRGELAALAPRRGAAVVRIVVTRGRGGRGYGGTGVTLPTRVVSVHRWPAVPAGGMRVTRCRTRLARNPRLAGIKHCNRLEQVLAAQELDQRWDEGLVADTEGHWIEGTRSNLFLVRDGGLLTPPLTASGVAGVMRAAVLDAAADAGIEVRVDRVDDGELAAAQELFLSNSLIGVRPVAVLDGAPACVLPAPGPVTARIAALVAASGACVT